jgi:hypothetical protein
MGTTFQLSKRVVKAGGFKSVRGYCSATKNPAPATLVHGQTSPPSSYSIIYGRFNGETQLLCCELDGPTRNALLDRTPKVQAHGQGTIDSSLCCRASSQRLISNTGPEGTLRSEDKEVVRASPICSISGAIFGSCGSLLTAFINCHHAQSA